VVGPPAPACGGGAARTGARSHPPAVVLTAQTSSHPAVYDVAGHPALTLVMDPVRAQQGCNPGRARDTDTIVSTSPGPPVDPTTHFTALYQAHYAHVLAYAQRRVDLETARDVTAETFAIAWRRGSEPAMTTTLASPDAQLPWLYATARRVLANQLRRDAHRHHLDLAAVAATAAGVPVVVDIATGVGERDALTRALARLSPRDQEALQLAVWEELTPTQAAEVTGCSLTAYKVRLHRARRRLQTALRLEDDRPLQDSRAVSRAVSRAGSRADSQAGSRPDDSAATRSTDRRPAPASSTPHATSQEQR
jgi:RNA polymerase sigma factor (sigma-70 family)